MKLSDERLAELIEWHEAFPLNVNGKDTLAALRELVEVRAERDRLVASVVEARRLLAFVVAHSNARYVLTDSFLSDTLAWTNESLKVVPLAARQALGRAPQ